MSEPQLFRAVLAFCIALLVCLVGGSIIYLILAVLGERGPIALVPVAAFLVVWAVVFRLIPE